MASLHFMHPYWLLALPPLVALAVWLARRRGPDGAWPRIVDRELLPSLRLAEGNGSRVPWIIVGLAWGLAALALAGPTWQRQITPGYRAPAAWVLAVELAPSMEATDTPPSRIARARFAVDDLLAAAHDARVGLVAFAGEAYTVAPLTRDVATVRHLAEALSPSLMPTTGDELAPALDQAARLLEAAPGRDRQIIVLTDGFTDPAQALRTAQQLRRRGIDVNIVGVGTVAGAPEPDGNGSFVKNASGQVVMARLDTGLLQHVATLGGGHYVTLVQLPRLIKQLQATDSSKMQGGVATPHVKVASWLDDGIWFLPAILLLAAAVARRGWL